MLCPMTTMECYKHVPILCDEALPDFMSIDCKHKFGSLVHHCLIYINICPGISSMTAVEYCKYAPIICDEIMPDFVRSDCKTLYYCVP